MPGGRLALTQMLPSLSSGRNSVPSLGIITRLTIKAAKALTTTNFHRRLLDHLSQSRSVAGLPELAQATKDVFDHNDRAIHDDAEVHRAERQQVCRNAAPGQADERCQQREWYNEGNYGRRPEIA